MYHRLVNSPTALGSLGPTTTNVSFFAPPFAHIPNSAYEQKDKLSDPVRLCYALPAVDTDS
jgi:hypothetical protein